ncbi:rbfA [Wigglesworthia glossinidia endosymbiont of Glossina brevipalpis]|uniref:Ribosome-binding factor A n=1 Tax=Wigglesworthia glossinidia brevipalpis TaxID=36870 RepID=RBFA_WIGBR|nr:RecName: Full=Ribosome-binding factor A [Wigglesworthia glossinidia endosymbiont of Glossina brevipalpis]BAC24371.1 rbfA [Wigglesworthia glossinidia endosymbiont of Glossina brevipalpis]
MHSRENNRKFKISKEIQRKIALILQQKINDPRIGISTVSGVDLSSDFSHAKIFVTFLNKNTKQQIKSGLFILNKASFFIRKILNKTMRLRIIPKLTFIYDYSLIKGRNIDDLFNNNIVKISKKSI